MNGDGGGNGLGNLADELAGLDDDYDDYDDYDEDVPEGEYDDDNELQKSQITTRGNSPHKTPGTNFEDTDDTDLDQKGGQQVRDSGVDVEHSPSRGSSLPHRLRNNSLGVPSPSGKHGHRRKGSAYDGSEYGSESDLDNGGMPPRLIEKMDEVESLARRGTEKTGGPLDGTFQRVTEGLRDLGSQAGVEGGATRYFLPNHPPTWIFSNANNALFHQVNNRPLGRDNSPEPSKQTNAQPLLPTLVAPGSTTRSGGYRRAVADAHQSFGTHAPAFDNRSPVIILASQPDDGSGEYAQLSERHDSHVKANHQYCHKKVKVGKRSRGGDQA